MAQLTGGKVSVDDLMKVKGNLERQITEAKNSTGTFEKQLNSFSLKLDDLEAKLRET